MISNDRNPDQGRGGTGCFPGLLIKKRTKHMTAKCDAEANTRAGQASAFNAGLFEENTVSFKLLVYMYMYKWMSAITNT